MGGRQTEFRELQRNLGLSAREVADLIGRSVSVVHQYRSAGKHARIPPEDVLKVMRAAWRKKAMENLEQAIATIRAVGLDIDWTSLEVMLEGRGVAPSGLPERRACRSTRMWHRTGDHMMHRIVDGDCRARKFSDHPLGYAHPIGDHCCRVEGR
ncbi:helix-turn-helix domain-containing protein [Microvirga massiliensis]|uniref:helix-turn-helix domain-containing protein n=1 Tax=Microvirga massiliensis TaxID=1033741 RepID=UPI00062BDAA3|nr:helix-turn-helix transcriptional regulator [Microvirga massiliensis]